MQITTIGIDLAKNVFQVHGVDERGKTVLKKRVKRDQMAAFFAKLPGCLIGGISKRGDVYLRTLLIHGARSAIVAAQRSARQSLAGWSAAAAR